MKKNVMALAAIAFVMFGFPRAAVTFAPGDAGMAVCFLLFFAVDPICSLCMGIFAGLAVKQRIFLPIVNGLAFLLGVWTVFDWGNPDFYGYAVTYLVIALAAMLVTATVAYNVRKKRNQG